MSNERQDAEQQAKHQEIMDILIAAGYFRARIKGLSPFDKIVGGMVFCIEALDEDVDVDLLFHESLTIGQKISLTEKIVVVLPRLGCPFTIEPHQIQGLDFINIFPVVQWLVKRSVENRAEKAGRLFSFAVDQFHNDFELASSKDIVARREEVLERIEAVEKRHQPKRRFRRRDVAEEEEEARVKVTLLEYGSQTVSTQKKGVEGVSEYLSNLALDEDDEKFVEFDEETRDAVFDDYSTLVSEFSKDDKEIEYQRQVALLRATKQDLERRLEVLREENAAVSLKKDEKAASLASLEQRAEELGSELKRLKEKHSTEDKETFEKLASLLQRTEEQKASETQFKQECKETLAGMQDEIEELERLAGEDAEEDNRSALESEKQNLQAIRLKLAKKNRQIVVLQRQLDNVPTRAELAQYQRRFLELYNQVSAKHRETKQFYTLFNTLSDTKLYIEKEIGLLNSIYENFTATTASGPLREQFLKQLEGIVVGIKETKVRVQKKSAEERLKKDKLTAELGVLLEQQRKYAVAIKQLKQLLHDRQEG